MNRDTFLDRIALLLWRDRDGYNPATGEVTQQYNVSLLTRLRVLRSRAGRVLFNGNFLLGLMAGGFAIAAALLPGHLDRAKADKQVNAAGGELLLDCTEQGHGVFLCRRVNRQDQIASEGRSDGANDNAGGGKP